LHVSTALSLNMKCQYSLVMILNVSYCQDDSPNKLGYTYWEQY
jgi:hypothetical protein